MNWFTRLFPQKRIAPPVQGSNIKACCLVPENRVLVASDLVRQANGTLLPTEVRQCRVCGCKHHRMYPGRVLEPGKVGVN